MTRVVRVLVTSNSTTTKSLPTEVLLKIRKYSEVQITFSNLGSVVCFASSVTEPCSLLRPPDDEQTRYLH